MTQDFNLTDFNLLYPTQGYEDVFVPKMDFSNIHNGELEVRNTNPKVKEDDFLNYMTHQQGVQGTKWIVGEASGEGKIPERRRADITRNMKSNVYKDFYQKYDQVTPANFLDYWRNKWQSKYSQYADKSTKFDEQIAQAAELNGLSPAFLKTVIGIESDFNPKAKTGSYQGLFQIGPQEAKDLGMSDRMDAMQSITKGAQLLSQHRKELFKYEDGGIVDGPRKPIITNNPNDPRLKAYQDSLINNQNFDKMDKLLSSQENVNRIKQGNRVLYSAPTRQGGKDFLPFSLLLNNGISSNKLGLEHDQSDYAKGSNARNFSAPIAPPPVQPIQYQAPQKQPQPVIPPTWQRLPDGATIGTPIEVPQFSQMVEHVNGQSLNLPQATEGDYSATFRTNQGYNDQSTRQFANQSQFEAFIQAMRGMGKESLSENRGKNIGSVLYPRL